VPRRSGDADIHERDRNLLLRLERHGWFVMKVGAGDGAPAFAYSLGLFENFNHPEIILFGLDLETMHTLINDVGELVRSGQRFAAGDTSDQLLDGFTCAFRPVAKSQYGAHVTYTVWYYGNEEFPVLQLVWPDMNGRFPWDGEFDERYRPDQPDLRGESV
jgi:hypothetical protein